MKDVVGSPGTKTGLLLRIGQCGFAAASIALMVCSAGFSNYTAFWLAMDQSYQSSSHCIHFAMFRFQDSDKKSGAQLHKQSTMVFTEPLSKLFGCIYGTSSALELWSCMSGCLCLEDKERPSKSCLSEPICCR
ncbi:uncharacterized protein LOC130804887 isoform X2 [Amaranthus tricolor]|uniref:uncharacterized protein LOC130804887 isoform X2 n=1 Tax=Amaranthus tricolor TaxID=29722 RepID=UPI00258C4638|nr:uncharacterized protein LOC130804887 isoform X2 [Amaranthus tricolor]XP_057525510.1 uncharacterized protein LOC130804887 isoform X2 [Amaranthus tricolor]